MPPDPVNQQPWHQALVFALVGDRRAELGVQAVPDLDSLERWLRDHDLVEAAIERARERRVEGLTWPYPVPAELVVPPAQLVAALYALRLRLGLLAVVAAPAPQRALTADEVRLMRDVPPHHGG